MVVMTCMSCRKELCYDHYPSINLNFDWELEWERDYGMSHITKWDPDVHHFKYDELRPSVPEWVKMIRYFDDGRVVERFFSPDVAKYEVSEDDRYSMLFYNGDTEYIILSDVASLHDARATATSRTRAGASLQSMKDMYHSRTTNSPDVIYSAYVDQAPGVMNHQVKEMPIKMQPLVYTYLVTYEFEHGLEYVDIARGALGGMAEGVYLRTGVTTDETSIILFDCSLYSKGCRCQVRSFGIPGFPDSYFGRTQPGQRPYTLSLEVRLKNGKSAEFTFDITDQIKNQPRGGVIKVSGIRIEDEIGNEPGGGGGFDVDVSDWDDDVVEIELNAGLIFN